MSRIMNLLTHGGTHVDPAPSFGRTDNPRHERSSKMAMQSAVVDIHQLIEDYAWEQFVDLQVASKKNEYKGLERDDVSFEINTKKMPMIHEEPDYQGFHPTSSKPWSLFKTVFTNNTDRCQEYSFKTERTTESTCTVIKEQGYCFGMEAQMSLKTPCEILEANAGFHHEISFAKATENTVAETLSWGVDSNIVVPGRYQTSAELVVEEVQYSGSFVLVTYLSGRVVVSLIRRRDNALILPISAGIVEIFREAMQNKNSQSLKNMVNIENNRLIKLTTKGSCNFKFAGKQKVDVTEEPLPTHRKIMED